MIPDSGRTVGYWRLFLAHPTNGTNVRLPKMHHTLPEVDFESSRSPAKSESWIKPNLKCCAVYPHDHVVGNRLCHECKKSSQTSVTSLSPFCDHRMSGLPILAKYKHFKTTSEHTFDNSPTDSSSAFLIWWSSTRGVETLFNCSVFFVRQFAISPNIFFEHVLPCRRTTRLFAWCFSHLVTFQLPQQGFVIQTSLYTLQ